MRSLFHRFWVRAAGGDLSYEVSEAQWGTLPNACAFAMCLAAGSDGVRFDCMRMFPLAAPNVVCDEGWFVDFG